MDVGLIGARGFGQHHLEGFQSSPFVERIVIAGRDRAALEALRGRFPKVRAVTADYRELLDDPSVELVDIVLPHDLHAPVAREAFARGKHVLVEKPPARTPEELAGLTAAADAAGRRLFVVMNLLFSTLHRTVRAIVDSGALGRPFLSLEVNLSQALRIYDDPGNWRADRERSGGGLQIDGGFHGVYRQLYFLESLGAPRTVTADCAQIGVEAPTKGEDFSAITLAYSTGARVHLMSQWTARASLGPFPSGILGTEGSLLLTRDERRPLLLRRPSGADEAVPVPEGPEGFASTVAECVRHYVECLATHGPPHVETDLAALTLEIIRAAYHAADTGCRQHLTGAFSTRFPGTCPAPAPGGSER